MRALMIYPQFYDFNKDCHCIGGVETYLRNLCEVLKGCGIGPTVIFCDKMNRESIVDGVELIGVNASVNWKADLQLKAVEVGRSDDDLLIFGSSTLISRTAFKKSVAIQHGIYWDTERFKGLPLSGVKALLARAFQGKKQLDLHALVSRMVCVDLSYVNWMRALSVANRLPYTYIPNFADTSKAVPVRKSDGKVRIVFARRFEAIRGCGLLIDVMPRVLREHPEVELIIAGGGSLEDDLHGVFDGEERVAFTRYDAGESVEFHGRFDIALVPSIASEGTSLSLLEAMSAGCAVVATDVGGMSNIVLSGHNGILVRPEADDLYQAVSRLVSDTELRNRLSRNARQTVEDSFSRERWAESWTEVLKEFA